MRLGHDPDVVVLENDASALVSFPNGAIYQWLAPSRRRESPGSGPGGRRFKSSLPDQSSLES